MIRMLVREIRCVALCCLPSGFGSSFRYHTESGRTDICPPLKLKSRNVGNCQKAYLSNITGGISVDLLMFKDSAGLLHGCLFLMTCFLISLPQNPLMQIKSQKKIAKNCCFLGNRDSSPNSTWVGVKGFCWLKLTYIFSIHYFLIMNM